MPGQLEKGDDVVGATAEFTRFAAVAPHAEGMLDERRAAVPDQACEHVVANAETLEQGVVLKRPPDAEPRGCGSDGSVRTACPRK